jgi:hypothetical protein
LNTNSFSERDYVLGVNREFLETAGQVTAVPIHFDLPEDELLALLAQLDGVHFTGGGLHLYNFTTNEWHPYYITARRIFKYATENRVYQNGLV